ncbi:MAG: sterol desaturase/sphingolipid hydroxylase (fatty acid hydroxylase superfamily) [Alteromonadaceae bacterium]|jgi:sterol desaturase/sphingolipid hydroxylase (fatty acid hydroxylase superfamily)
MEQQITLFLEEIDMLFITSEAFDLVAIFFIFNLSLVLIEIVVDLLSSKKRLWQDTGANIIIFLLGQLMEKLLYSAISLGALFYAASFVPYEIPNTWWSWGLGLLAADLSYYWMHRTEHKHRILWASHSVHHSSKEYNLSIALRLSIVEGLFEWIFLLPMIFIGFNPLQTIICLIFIVEYQTWIHTKSINKLGWLDKVFNTPSVHRVHHGSNRQYLDKNFAGILLIWDKLFGTFQKEEEDVTFGLTININTYNPLKINFIEYKNIWLDVKKRDGLMAKLSTVFGGLVWKPKK